MSVNAVEGVARGSLPGHTVPNVRRPLIRAGENLRRPAAARRRLNKAKDPAVAPPGSPAAPVRAATTGATRRFR